MAGVPLLIFDTNVLLDVWLRRDGVHAALLVNLAEQGRIELVVPEYVLLEFRGVALRWIRDEQERAKEVRRNANGWGRCLDLDAAAEDMRRSAADVEALLARLAQQVDEVVDRVKKTARVPSHTLDVHMRGELRRLEGRPPDRPVEGLSDCTIYEALLQIARDEAATSRQKVFVTRDSDFDEPELIDELAALGVVIRKDSGRLYGELR